MQVFLYFNSKLALDYIECQALMLFACNITAACYNGDIDLTFFDQVVFKKRVLSNPDRKRY